MVKAVAEGGVITFNCGPKPVTIMMTATAKVVNTSHRVVLDGGGKVTLSGGAKIRILYMNTCDPAQKWTTGDCWEQQWPQLVVQNISFVNAYSGVQETASSNYGGGAIFDQGGQLKVVNSAFIDDRCYKNGPDLGGGAIRALGMYMKAAVYINHDTFTDNSCSNGAALSGLYANFYVVNSLMTNNKAIGFGANPAGSGTAGGGSGGAIYTDGNSYNLTIAGTAMSGNTAREGGGAIFYVVDGGPGTLRIAYSTLHHNHQRGVPEHAGDLQRGRRAGRPPGRRALDDQLVVAAAFGQAEPGRSNGHLIIAIACSYECGCSGLAARLRRRAAAGGAAA